LIADQQIAMNQMSQSLHQQNMHTHLLTVQHKRELEQATDAIRDLKERARWLEDQNKALGQQFEAVKNGRIMRILHKLLPRP
jgi:protein involved in temperature-dependent protein secretion